MVGHFELMDNADCQLQQWTEKFGISTVSVAHVTREYEAVIC